MTRPRTIADVGELAVIARIAAALDAPPSPSGPGDDTAVLTMPGGRLLAGTDVLVEGVHFRLDWSSPEDVGAKAAAANLADVAAMGGTTQALLVALVAPGGTEVGVVEGLARGLGAEAARAGAEVVGGDVSAGPLLVVAVSALGRLDGGEPVLRSGARPGEQLVLAGRTGRSAAGLALLAAGVPPPGGAQAGALAAGLLEAHRRPRPPYELGPALARAGASAMCDVSDGLLADAGQLAAASGVALEIERLALPAGVSLAQALTGGEDHALLATLAAGAALPAGARSIGRVVAGDGVHLTGVLATAGRALAGGTGGFAHFGPHARPS